MSNSRPLSQKERRELEKRRKQAAQQAKSYHKQQKKKAEKSSASKRKADKKSKNSSGKLEQIINSQNKKSVGYERISREEKFRRESNKRIRNLEPHDFEDGYYIDEYGARQKQEHRAKVIREQENEVIRRNKKPLSKKQIKIRRVLLSVGIIVAVLVIGVILSLTVLFKTEKIDIDGDEYYYDDQIIAFSNVNLQQNIFIAAMQSTAQEIEDNLPYVEKAEIGFSIPDTITIKITDAVPSYVIKDGNNFLLISSKGRILDSLTENTDSLPELICGELKSKVLGDYVSFNDDNIPEILQGVAESLQDNDVDKITSFDVTDTSSITLDYDNRIKINIGLPEDIDYKIRTAMKIITEKLDPNNTETITGTLDVSTCNSTKMSHYVPGEAVTNPTTATDATESATASADSYDSTTSDDYSWNGTDNYYGGTDSYGADTYSYDADTYSYGGDTNNYSYDNGADSYSYDYGANYSQDYNAYGGYAEAPQY